MSFGHLTGQRIPRFRPRKVDALALHLIRKSKAGIIWAICLILVVVWWCPWGVIMHDYYYDDMPGRPMSAQIPRTVAEPAQLPAPGAAAVWC